MVGRRVLAWCVAAVVALAAVRPSVAQGPEVAGRIEWGLWIDDDGCMHWWADGGTEGYMLDRVNPRTGKPVCLRREACLSRGTGRLFEGDTAALTAQGRDELTRFFRATGAYGYIVQVHTDDSGSEAANRRLSADRARAVADLAKAAGAVLERQGGYGGAGRRASNATAAGREANRPVEILCYRW